MTRVKSGDMATLVTEARRVMSDGQDWPKARQLSTLGVPDGDQIERWREFMSDIYYTLDVRSDAPLGLRGLLRESRFNDFSVSAFEAQAHLVTRHASDAQADGADDLVLLFPVSGSFSYQQRKSEARIENGDVVLLTSAEAYSVLVSENAQNITMKIPAQTLRLSVPWIDRFCANSGFAAPETVRLLRNFCADMMLVPSESHRRILQTACFDIVRLLVEEGKNSVMGQRLAGTAKQTLLEGIQVFIRRNFRTHNLDTASVARYLGVSERYVQKVLSEFKLSFQNMLRNHRLHEARLMITSENFGPRLQIGQIAFLCGFASQSYFSTLYRSAFGISPRDDFLQHARRAS